MGMEWVLVLLIGLLSTLMLVFLNPWPCTLTLAGITMLLWFMELFFLQKMQIFISVTYPFITLFVNFSLLSVIRFRMEEKKMIRRTRDMVAAQNLTLIGITSLWITGELQSCCTWIETPAKFLIIPLMICYPFSSQMIFWLSMTPG